MEKGKILHGLRPTGVNAWAREKGRMGLLDKNNPDATLGSVLRRAALSAICGCIVFFLAFKTQYVTEWKIALPLWLLLCAFVGAICEWQVPKESDEEKEQKDEKD